MKRPLVAGFCIALAFAPAGCARNEMASVPASPGAQQAETRFEVTPPVAVATGATVIVALGIMAIIACGIACAQ